MSICRSRMCAGVRGPVLVPALRDARPRVHGGADRRARAAGCPALVVTLDLPLQALRRRDPKNGLAVPPELTWASAPRFLAARAGSSDVCAPGAAPSAISRHARKRRAALSEWIGGQFDASLNWTDVAWVRSLAGKTDPQGGDGRRRRPPRGRQPAPMRWWFPITAAGSSTAPSPPSPPCRGSSRRVGRSRGVFDGGVQLGPGRVQGPGAGRTACLIGKGYPMVWPRAANPA